MVPGTLTTARQRHSMGSVPGTTALLEATTRQLRAARAGRYALHADWSYSASGGVKR